MYSIQLYGDFSGGIDVVSGVAALFGVGLDENFKRPYFAKSITDFWHRWHITLGTWMKDYVFYPVSLSKWMGKFTKRAKKVFGKKTGRTLPICLANLIVFLVVGIWHGAAWKFIVYGLYNGVIIAVSGLLANSYRQWKKKLHINEKSKLWISFQILRTFILVNISWFFDRADDIPQALHMMKNAVTHFQISQLWLPGTLPLGDGSPKFTTLILLTLAAGCVILLVHSLMEEHGIDVGHRLMERPAVLRFAVYTVLFFMLPGIGALPASMGGFIYAQF